MTGGNSLTRPEAREQVRLTRTRRHGATIVEFSLVFLVFVVVLVALMEFGRAMWTYATIAHAARQGARYCMVHGTENTATISGHCCPVKSRIESIGWGHRGIRLGSRMAGVPVKGAFFRIA